MCTHPCAGGGCRWELCPAWPIKPGGVPWARGPLRGRTSDSPGGTPLYGMVWYGMVWYGMVWYGMVWYGMVRYGMVWYGARCHSQSLHDMHLAPHCARNVVCQSPSFGFLAYNLCSLPSPPHPSLLPPQLPSGFVGVVTGPEFLLGGGGGLGVRRFGRAFCFIQKT